MIDQRTAILKAADSIEAHPEWFDFQSVDNPDGCGTPACALGWISYHACLPDLTIINSWSPTELENYMGMSNSLFYKWMTNCADEWKLDATVCAKALRLYADKYFPAQQENLESAQQDNLESAQIIELRAA